MQNLTLSTVVLDHNRGGEGVEENVDEGKESGKRGRKKRRKRRALTVTGRREKKKARGFDVRK